MKFQLPALPWKKNELEPFLSAETVDVHYFGHHKSYIDKTNELIEKLGLDNVSLEKIILNYDGTLYDQAAQAWNHTFYWLGLGPRSAGPTPDGPLMNAIDAHYGSLEGMKERFKESAGNLFGSGWTWLVANDRGEIDFVNTHNGDNPIRYESSHPLWACDLWEHAYYLDYQNQRKAYLDAAWKHVNWGFVEDCFRLRRIPNMSKLMTVPEDPSTHPAPFLI